MPGSFLWVDLLIWTFRWNGLAVSAASKMMKGEKFLEVRNGCPMVSREEGQKLMRWLEGFQVHQCRKLAIVKALMADESMVDKSTLDLEIAMTLKVKEMFPNLPDDVAMGVIPRLDK